ncbi:MAG: helix-turn-helix transcriptional regulator [Solirubrobacteraceae bacterium]|nr:helix-turn-helix transcriptional regulator [Solirubrobacteraceae bacterium]
MLPPVSTPIELPVYQPHPPERADAARNRRRILAAAERLFAERGVAQTSMDAIAAEAGVGKGTLFRRFGDRASLALAVLDEKDRQFQDALLHGPPPLGPGAPPCARLRAFGEAMLDRLEENLDLLLDAQTAAGNYLRSEPYSALWLHVRLLVQQARPDCDADYTTDVLLGALTAPVFAHQRKARGMDLDRLKAGYADLVDRLMTAPIRAGVS